MEIIRASDRKSLMEKYGFDVKRDGDGHRIYHRGKAVAKVSTIGEAVSWFEGYLYAVLVGGKKDAD